MKNSRFIIAVITNLLDEALIVAVILWGLPQLGVNIPLWGTILICIGFIVYAMIFYIMGSKALIRRPTPGFTDQIELKGKAVDRLSPEGTVKIAGELWTARAENGPIQAGSPVIVVGQKGFKLIVRRRDSDI
jgi:membrane-bound ClpP family serine protease